jgi:hypothetical protein
MAEAKAPINAEAESISEVLGRAFAGTIDGCQAILALKAVNYNWRQMEWIGWYFEYFAREALVASLGGGTGPSFGRTGFDYQRSFVWDLKAHPRLDRNGRLNRWAVLNDQEAIHRCIDERGGVGFVIGEGLAAFDTEGEFKRWHDDLKGGMSTYEQRRVARGALSRARKTAFSVDALHLIFFATRGKIMTGLSQGWLAAFQEGMRNADGSPRRAKYILDVSNVPKSIRPVQTRRL